MSLVIVYISGRPLRALLEEGTAQDNRGSQMDRLPEPPPGERPQGCQLGEPWSCGAERRGPSPEPTNGVRPFFSELSTDFAKQVFFFFFFFFNTRKTTLIISFSVCSKHSINIG